MRPRKHIDKARRLRAEMTDAERRLWMHLRDRRLLGFKFRRQQPLHGYVADFVCMEVQLIVELDGGQHLDRQRSDEYRTRVLTANGFRVIRFWNDDVLLRMDAVLEEILRRLRDA